MNHAYNPSNRLLLQFRRFLGNYEYWLAPLLVGGFAFIFAVEKIYNYDIWWHLRFGADLVTTHSYPFSDSWTFSTAGEPWVNSSWLFGLLAYLLQHLVGLDGLIVFKATVIAAGFAGACHFLIRQGVHPLLALFMLGAAVPLTRFRFLLRPIMVTFPGAILFFGLYYTLEVLDRRKLLLLAAASILWINLHGSGFLALILTGCFALEVSLGRHLPFLRQNHATTISATRAWLLFFLIAGCMLITPNGLQLITAVLERGYDDLVTQTYTTVQEHASLRWGEHQAYWGLMLATAASFVATWRRCRLFSLFVFLASTWLALGSVRFVGLGIFLQSIILCLNLGNILKHIETPRIVSGWLTGCGYAALLGMGYFLFTQVFSGAETYSWGVGVQDSRFPAEEAQFLQEKGFSGNIYNTWKYGGYLLWNVPKAKIFIDGRASNAQIRLQEKHDGMSAAQLHNYLKVQHVDAAVLAKTDLQLVDYFNAFPDFKGVLLGGPAILYLRASLVDTSSQPYRFIRLESYDVSYLIPLAKGDTAAAVENELRRAVMETTGSFTSCFQLAFFLELLDRNEALTYYRKAAEANASMAFIHFPLVKMAAKFALRHSQYADVIAFYAMAEKAGIKRDSEDEFLLGTAYYLSKDYGKAEQAYLQAVKSPPIPFNLLTNLGYLYLDTDRLNEAETFFQQAIQLDPENEAGYYGLAVVRERLHHPLRTETWRDFLTRFPDSRYASKAHKALE